MRRKRVIATTYVVAAGFLLALGAAARYSREVSAQPAPSGNAGRLEHGQMGSGMMGGQMGQGMTSRGMMAARQKMRDLVDELMENQAAMEKVQSVRGIRPLLRKNHALIEQLNDEMARSWGMKGQMHGARMGARMGSPGPARRQAGAASTGKPKRSATQIRVVTRGKEVFRAHACGICHGETGRGTQAGASLVGVGKKYSTEEIAELIRHPATTKMPSFSRSAMSDADLKAVIAYLETLK